MRTLRTIPDCPQRNLSASLSPTPHSAAAPNLIGIAITIASPQAPIEGTNVSASEILA
ncbi:MAG: hypothetical protein K1X52_06240 [Pyrinomonadaceae bacterium]|nr:hypothetical protein [Pyrinomonadaceae bacterium]